MSDSRNPMDCTWQAPLSMGLSRQEYWSELSFPSPGDCPVPRIKPRSTVLQAHSLPPSHLESLHPLHTHTHTHVSSSPNCRSMCFKLNNSLLLTLGLLEGPLFSLSPVPGSLCLGGLFSSCCPGPVFQKATTLTWRWPEGLLSALLPAPSLWRVTGVYRVQAQMLQQDLSQFPALPPASSFFPLGTLMKACRWAQTWWVTGVQSIMPAHTWPSKFVKSLADFSIYGRFLLLLSLCREWKWL